MKLIFLLFQDFALYWRFTGLSEAFNNIEFVQKSRYRVL